MKFGGIELGVILRGVYSAGAGLTCPPQTSPVERSDTGYIEGRQKYQEKDIALNRF
jgi:hypothetical protein